MRGNKPNNHKRKGVTNVKTKGIEV